MRKLLFDVQKFPTWAKADARYKRLEELDRYLDGEIYDDLDYVFYEEETSNGTFIKIKRRRPAVRFNLYAAFADQIARDTWAGFNAPLLQHAKENVRLAFEALKKETRINTHMLELTNWVTTGSSVCTFKIVPFGKGKAKAVMKTYRSKQCTPFFNELDELDKLRVHYVIAGAELLAIDMKVCFDGSQVKADRPYWYVRDYGATEENTYYPIPEHKWKPMEVNSEKLIPIEEFRHVVELGFAPAHWFKRRTGKIRSYDGRCVWENAIPNIIEFDYSMSQMGAGVRYNAAPQVVIKGKVANADDDGHFVGGPSRYLHFEADQHMGEGLSQTGSDAHLLEASGAGMKVGIELYGALLREIATLVICASRKDPNKITTAMSAKGMEILDKEYFNLIQEFRTVCGDGYEDTLKKMMAACIIAKHPLAEGITLEDIDGLTLKWPPINPIGAQEFLYLCQGAAQLLQATEAPAVPPGAAGAKPASGDKPKAAAPVKPEPEKEPIMTRKELRSYLMGSIDLTMESTDKDYIISSAGLKDSKAEPGELSDEERKTKVHSSELLAYAEAAMKAAQGDEVDTSFRVGEGE